MEYFVELQAINGNKSFSLTALQTINCLQTKKEISSNQAASAREAAEFNNYARPEQVICNRIY